MSLGMGSLSPTFETQNDSKRLHHGIGHPMMSGAPYDVGGQAKKCDGGTDVVLWWGDWAYIVRHIAHPRVHSMALWIFFCNKECCASL